MVNSQSQRPTEKSGDLIFRLRDTERTEYLIDYATDLTVSVVERCIEPSSPSDSKTKISREERDALKLLIQNVSQIYPPRRFVALLVATLIYVERIEGRTHMKEGVNISCSVFVGGVILASRVMQDQKISYEDWGQCTNIHSRKTLMRAEKAMRCILHKSFSLPDSRVQHHLDVVDSLYMDKTAVPPMRISPSSMARTASGQSELSFC
ncbi:hypothetical protein BJ322DRAFT_1208823 [Thelephora terrestris]|uniref:Cyclin N-terminal domain-containing protein n=1 Tax=Thelephora terrestris TaxID=56493 RepID=A0A9P6LAT1_9AGAM|nr:hypothetical protein BJ322DRAFT_1208823 [Thelephora terrestris]